MSTGIAVLYIYTINFFISMVFFLCLVFISNYYFFLFTSNVTTTIPFSATCGKESNSIALLKVDKMQQ